MNTEIEVLESQYRTARQNRRQAWQALNALSSEFQYTNEACEHLERFLSCLRELKKYHEDFSVVHEILVKFQQQSVKLNGPYSEAARADKDARYEENQCKKRLDEAEQAAS